MNGSHKTGRKEEISTISEGYKRFSASKRCSFSQTFFMQLKFRDSSESIIAAQPIVLKNEYNWAGFGVSQRIPAGISPA